MSSYSLLSARAVRDAGPALGYESRSSTCPSPSSTASAVAASDGSFSVNALPIGHALVSVELDGRWHAGAARAMTMHAGMGANIAKVSTEVRD